MIVRPFVKIIFRVLSRAIDIDILFVGPFEVETPMPEFDYKRENSKPISRRSMLAGSAGALGVTVAGCLGDGDADDDESDDDFELPDEHFSIDGSTILDPYGEEFYSKGTNVQGYQWVWPKSVVEDADLIADAWNFNSVRVNNLVTEGAREWPQFDDNDDLDELVETFTSREVVVILEEHTIVGGYYSDEQLATVEGWLAEIAEDYGDNPYVWFGIANEPGGMEEDNDHDLWEEQARTLIDAVRDTGAENPVVVPGLSWGQDSGPNWNDDPVEDEDSFILSRGPDLNEDYDDLVFDFHVYDQWRFGAERLGAFMDRAHELDLAIEIGETGVWNNNDIPEALEQMYEAAVPRNVGRIIWHWYGGDDNELCTSGSPEPGGYAIDHEENPTNLTFFGEKVWEDTHSDD